jgi:hypothetical protein
VYRRGGRWGSASGTAYAYDDENKSIHMPLILRSGVSEDHKSRPLNPSSPYWGSWHLNGSEERTGKNNV